MGIMKYFTIALAVLLLVAARSTWHYRAGERDALLRADSLEAALDTTRVLHLRDRDIYQRRAIQAEIERDSIDELLELERRASARLRFEISEMRTPAPVVADSVRNDSSDTRYASWHIRDGPYTVDINATVPPLPAPAIADVSVRVDPVQLGADVGCGVGGPIRPVTMRVDAPTWARVTLTDVRSHPDVCNATNTLTLEETAKVGGIFALLGILVWELVR